MNTTVDDFWRMIWQKRDLVIVSIVDFFDSKEIRPIAVYLAKNEGEGVLYWDLLVTTKKIEQKEWFSQILVELTYLKVI